jgi:hypothetical protein
MTAAAMENTRTVPVLLPLVLRSMTYRCCWGAAVAEQDDDGSTSTNHQAA